MTLNDQQIIDNTHFREEEDQLICYTLLPNEDRFEQAVSSREAVQKNMIGWCNTVRDYIKVKEARAEEERVARKKRRQSESPAESTPLPTSATPATSKVSPKALVLEHWENLKDARRNLHQLIAESEAELEAINTEMDELGPVIKAWKGVKGE